jgi:hypothetical protein
MQKTIHPSRAMPWSRALRVVAACATLSAVIALLLDNDVLTPVLIGSRRVSPAAKSMAVLSQVSILVLLASSSTRRVGSFLAAGFPLLACVALSLNGLAALLFGEFLRNPRAAGLIGLLGLQAAMFVMALLDLWQTRSQEHPTGASTYATGWIALWTLAYWYVWSRAAAS